MSTAILGMTGVILLIVLLMVGVHVGIALAVIGFIGLAIVTGLRGALGVLGSLPYSETAFISFTVLPMFLLMGELALQAKIGDDVYNAGYKWLGRLPGGLAMATVMACGLFAATSGSSLAMAAMFTKLALPEMLRFGYHPRLAAGAVAAGGTFAAMIPPSGMMVIYCIFTEQSVGKLAIAGVIPGIVNTLLYMMAIYLYVRIKPEVAPMVNVRFTRREKLLALWHLLPMGLLMLFIICSIYFGIATPTEAGAVGALGALTIAIVRKRLTFKKFIDSLMATASTTAMIFLIIVGAFIFSRFLAVSGLTTTITRWFTSLPVPPLVVILFFMFIFLLLGTFLDVIAMCALTLPLFFPIVKSLGINGIWFGILTIEMIETAFVTPPLGMNVYVVKAAAGDSVSLEDIFMGVACPFLLADAVFLALLFIFPQMALWLPGLMMGG